MELTLARRGICRLRSLASAARLRRHGGLEPKGQENLARLLHPIIADIVPCARRDLTIVGRPKGSADVGWHEA